jgi:hypothetical protein
MAPTPVGFPAPTGSCPLVTTLQGIAANQRGVPTATGRGEWQPVQVSRVLVRRAYRSSRAPRRGMSSIYIRWSDPPVRRS